MQIHISQAKQGCVLAKDVLGKSGKPIMLKQTVLTEKHIKVLERFLIANIHVFDELEDGREFIPDQSNEETMIKTDDQSFFTQYKQTVRQFKELFSEWIAFQTVDIPKLRKITLPLFDRLLDHKNQVFLSFVNVDNEEYFFHKQIAVSCLSYLLAKELNYSQGECVQVGLASLLADAGMIKLDEIQHSSFSLTSERKLQSIEHHPALSYRLIEDTPILTQAVKVGVLQHHERLDGSGYPLQLSEPKIHPFAQIIAICDEYYRIFSTYYIKNNDINIQLIKQLEKESEQKLSQAKMSIFIQRLNHSVKDKLL